MPMRLHLVTTSILFLGLLLGVLPAGCGPKGALYLPDDPDAEQVRQAG